jgi:hypothetical protein
MESKSEVQSTHKSSETTNVTDNVSKNAALNVVANHLEGSEIKALRKENLRLENNLKALKNQTTVHMDWYFDLVWGARGVDRDEVVLKKYEGAERERMKNALAKLSSAEEGDWQHGFNSGMLAASRLYSDFAHAGTHRYDDEDEEGEGEGFSDPDCDRECALQEFPCLDS